MPPISFKAEFAKAVQSGRKRQTIRAMRKHPIKPGDTLYFWTGCRRQGAHKLGEAVCTGVMPIDLSEDEISLGACQNILHWSDDLVAWIAHLDGFESADAMRAFFEPRMPFRGQLIYW
ncbi:MAG TPA: ASCH domain-containing protein [Candidatus Bathyarchaeia archaeon]|nr:ASCH domain-containing protein [Candidatus Bathyarchaeia archaeon]